jgi:hypothetical protein
VTYSGGTGGLVGAALLVSLLGISGCFPTAHTYTAKTLPEGAAEVGFGVGQGVYAQDPEEGEEQTYGYIWTTGDIIYRKGISDSLTGEIKGILGFLLGAEAAATLRLLHSGSVHLAVNGSILGSITVGGTDGITVATGRGLATIELGDRWGLTGGAEVGVWGLSDDSEQYYGATVGLMFPQDSASPGAAGIAVINVMWVEPEFPVVLFGYELSMGM